MSRSWSTFVFDKNLPKTDCVMYNSDKLNFINVVDKSYPTGLTRSDDGTISGSASVCCVVGKAGVNKDQCGNFGDGAGSNICPSGTDLLLRHQMGVEMCGGSSSFVGSQNNCCFVHTSGGGSCGGGNDCYYGTLDKCGNINPVSCDIGTAIATITGYKLLSPKIDYSHGDAVKGDGIKIPQTSDSSANINGEGVIGCTYQYDFSNFITNQTEVRKLSNWINDLYNGITYLQ